MLKNLLRTRATVLNERLSVCDERLSVCDERLYSYSLPGYTLKAGLKLTNIKLGFIKDLLLLLENNIRGGLSSVMGDQFVESNESKQI